jgi:hypothetical protein
VPERRDAVDPGTRRSVGLCADCQRARPITSSHGSVFYLCEYSTIDPAYPKYPRLPVLQCAAYLKTSVDT